MRSHKDLFLRTLQKFLSNHGRRGRLLLEAVKDRCEARIQELEVDGLIETASTRAALLDPTRPLDQKETRLACVALFREFEGARLGHLIVGRRQHRTRFRFSRGGLDEAAWGSAALWEALDDLSVATPDSVFERELDQILGPAKREPERTSPPGSAEMPRKDEILSQLRSHSEDLRRLGISRLALFGSVARDEARPDSDVDLLAEFESGVTSEAFFDTKFFLEDLLGRRIDLVTEAALRERVRAAIEPELIRVA